MYVYDIWSTATVLYVIVYVLVLTFTLSHQLSKTCMNTYTVYPSTVAVECHNHPFIAFIIIYPFLFGQIPQLQGPSSGTPRRKMGPYDDSLRRSGWRYSAARAEELTKRKLGLFEKIRNFHGWKSSNQLTHACINNAYDLCLWLNTLSKTFGLEVLLVSFLESKRVLGCPAGRLFTSPKWVKLNQLTN